MSRQATDTLRRTWRADLTKAGLRLLPGPGFGVTHLVRRARVEAHLEFDDGPRFQLTATHPGVPRDLLVRLEGERGVIRRTFGPGDVRTWDETFDALAEVRGDPAWVLAALNPGTRKRLTDALNAGLTVKGGRLQGALVCERPAVLSAWVGFAVDLVTRLSLPTDRVGPNLLRRAEAESEPRLQAALLEALGDRLAGGTGAPPWSLARGLLAGTARELGLGLARRWIEADAGQAAALGEVDLLAVLPGAGPVARAAVATRLGAVGTARSLPALRGLAEAFFERGAVKAAAREALAAVLARTPTTAGGLAVVSVEAALSFADEEDAPVKVHHIALRTADPEALAAFYTSMLDLPVVRRQLPRSIWLGLEDAVLMIERAEPGEPGVAEGDLHLLALAVDAPTQARLRARLAAAGVRLDGETAFTLYLRDPDGRRVGLSTYPLRELDQPSA